MFSRFRRPSSSGVRGSSRLLKSEPGWLDATPEELGPPAPFDAHPRPSRRLLSWLSAVAAVAVLVGAASYFDISSAALDSPTSATVPTSSDAVASSNPADVSRSASKDPGLSRRPGDLLDRDSSPFRSRLADSPTDLLDRARSSRTPALSGSRTERLCLRLSDRLEDLEGGSEFLGVVDGSELSVPDLPSRRLPASPSSQDVRKPAPSVTVPPRPTVAAPESPVPGRPLPPRPEVDAPPLFERTPDRPSLPKVTEFKNLPSAGKLLESSRSRLPSLADLRAALSSSCPDSD